MSTAAGLYHAVERLRRWPHARSHRTPFRRRRHIRHRIARELDAIGGALLDLYRLPPRTVEPQRRVRP